MEEEKITLLGQLVSIINDDYTILERAYSEKDIEKFKSIKEEILKIQKRIENTIK